MQTVVDCSMQAIRAHSAPSVWINYDTLAYLQTRRWVIFYHSYNFVSKHYWTLACVPAPDNGQVCTTDSCQSNSNENTVIL